MDAKSYPTSPWYQEIGRRWLGLGNPDGPIWFCGLEPGGTDSPDWPTIWAERYDEAEVIDGRGQAGDPDHDLHFGANGKPQRTWQALIRTLLAYQGHAVDDLACLTFQREYFLAGDGDVALLELSAYAAAGMRVDVPREKYLDDRVVRIRELLEEKKPQIFVCYGTTRRKAFESIVGRPFDSEGFQMIGATVCALRTHPTPQFRAAPPASSWVELGLELRRRVDALRIR